MRIELAAFTDQGYALGERLADGLRASGEEAELGRLGGDRTLAEWTAGNFHHADALVFIGAVGIAVRAVAPFVVSKTSDPAVVVVDDSGRFAVSLLSGHIGGANALAVRIAGLLGCTPVITTATDGNRVFAVDLWAARNGLVIINPGRIKAVSAKLLAGEEVGLRSVFPVVGGLPGGLVLRDDGYDISLDIHRSTDASALNLVPPIAVLGVGCRRNTPAETIEEAFRIFCRDAGLYPEAFGGVSSIDRKKDEPGILVFCERHGLSFATFPPDVLASARGAFTSSPFVASVTGVDGVCERAAVIGSNGGRLLVGKTVVEGVALAAAAREFEARFSSGDVP